MSMAADCIVSIIRTTSQMESEVIILVQPRDNMDLKEKGYSGLNYWISNSLNTCI